MHSAHSSWNESRIYRLIMSVKDDDKVSFIGSDNSSTESEGHDYKLNLLMFKRLGNILKILFPSCTAITSLLFFILLLTAIIFEVVSYYNGLLPSNYYKVFLSRDNNALFKLIMMTACMVVASAVLGSCIMYAQNTVVVTWRKELTTSLQRYYLCDLNYYQMNVVERKLDNPDQRITQDVDKMVRTFVLTFRRCIMFPVIISFYSYQAYQVSGIYALIGSYSYIFFTLLINLCVTSPIVKYKAEVEKREGDFRFNHINIRVNAEAIAFQRAEPMESKQANRKLHFLLRAMQRVVNRVALADLPMQIFSNLQDLTSFIIMAVAILEGFHKDTDDADLGAIVAQNHFYISSITSTFMDVVSQYESIAEVAGTVHRIGEMFETMKLQSNSTDESFDKSDAGSLDVEYKLYDHKSSSGNDEVVPELDDNGNSTFCVFDDVTVLAPVSTNYGEIAVLEDMSFVFELGRNVLITGNGSCGKTTVLRLMRGLWEVSGGTVYRSNLMRLGSSAIFFQPEKILFSEGSFKQQIQFPDINDFRFQCDEDDATILRYVKMFHLDGLVSSMGGLDCPVNWNWYNVVSPNEAQRLCLARILYHRPKVIAIDNIFHGLEQSLIETFYNQCRKIGSTVVSVGDEDRLGKYHDSVINLNKRDVDFFALGDR